MRVEVFMSKARELGNFEKVAGLLAAEAHAAYTRMLQDVARRGTLKGATKRAVTNFLDCLNGSTITLDLESYPAKRPAKASFESRITIPESELRCSVEVIIDGNARF